MGAETPRFQTMMPFVVTALLTGMRFGELLSLRWADVDLEVGEIVLPPEATKTACGRRIPLDVTPALASMLGATRLKSGGGAFVFGGEKPMSRMLAESGRKRLIRRYGAPGFTWQTLRRTCGSFLTCAPSVYGAASAFLSAKRLGHSVSVAEAHYVGALTSISPNARHLNRRWGSRRCWRQGIWRPSRKDIWVRMDDTARPEPKSRS